MEGDGDFSGGGNAGGFSNDNDNSSSVRGPAYNDNSRDDLPFEPVSRNDDPFSAPEDPEMKYRLERERIAGMKETDVDEIRLCNDDDDDDGKAVKGNLAAVLGSSLANSVAEGIGSSQRPEDFRNGKSPLYSNFSVDQPDGYVREERSCAQDCIYFGVLCCQCSIL